MPLVSRCTSVICCHINIVHTDHMMNTVMGSSKERVDHCLSEGSGDVRGLGVAKTILNECSRGRCERKSVVL